MKEEKVHRLEVEQGRLSVNVVGKGAGEPGYSKEKQFNPSPGQQGQ